MPVRGNITASGDSASRRIIKFVDVPRDRLISASVQAQNYIRDFSAKKPNGVYHAVAYWLNGSGIFYVYQTPTSTVVRWIAE